MGKRKTKRQKRNRKIVIAAVLIIVLSLGIVGAVFVTHPETYPFGDGGGLFGLFGADDYGTGIDIDTSANYFENTGVGGVRDNSGREPLDDVYYQVTDENLGSTTEVSAQGGLIIRVNRKNPEQFWIQPYAMNNIDNYWYIVYYKDHATPNWVTLISNNFIDRTRIVQQVQGNGLQPGFRRGLKVPPVVFYCNPINFWVKTPETGAAVKVELHCKASWATGSVNDILLSSDEAYLAKREPIPPPEEPPIPPPDEIPSGTLIISTTPHAMVNLVGYEMKDSGASGDVTYTGLSKGRYLISIQKAGYYARSRQINFPDEQMVVMPLTYSRPDIEKSNDLIVKTNPTNCEVTVAGVGSKSSGNEGIARWNDLPDGKYTITVRKSGYRSGRGYVTLPAVLQYNEISFTISKLPDEPPPPEPPERPEYNQRPQVRTISGLHFGDVGIEYEFTATAYDPDDDILMYRFYWGDGMSTGWLAEGKAKHKYTAEGTYQIMVQAFDGETYGDSGYHQFVAGVAIGGGVELTVPLIEASNAQSGTYVRVTIRVQTEAESNDFDIRAYVKSPSNVYLVNTWSLSKTKNNGIYTATVTYKCDEEGIVTIGAQTVSKVDAYRSSVVTERAVYSTVGGIAEGAPLQPVVPSGEEIPEYEAPSISIPGFEAITFVIAAFVTLVILYKRRR